MIRNCPNCNAATNELHHTGCDVERCPACGLQLGSCDCVTDLPRVPWSGEFPGEAEAKEFGFWCRWGPTGGWIRCVPSEDGARPDLNRLIGEAIWSPQLRRWVLPKRMPRLKRLIDIMQNSQKQPADLLDELEYSIQLLVLAAVKTISERTKQTSGEMICPRCRTGKLRWRLSSNGHIRLRCDRVVEKREIESDIHCICAME